MRCPMGVRKAHTVLEGRRNWGQGLKKWRWSRSGRSNGGGSRSFRLADRDDDGQEGRSLGS